MSQYRDHDGIGNSLTWKLIFQTLLTELLTFVDYILGFDLSPIPTHSGSLILHTDMEKACFRRPLDCL